jgi:hypothetical protein
VSYSPSKAPNNRPLAQRKRFFMQPVSSQATKDCDLLDIEDSRLTSSQPTTLHYGNDYELPIYTDQLQSAFPGNSVTYKKVKNDVSANLKYQRAKEAGIPFK